MEYVATKWKDRVVEKPMTYTMTQNDDGTVTLTPAPGTVTVEGTQISASLLNNIENGISDLVSALNDINSDVVLIDDDSNLNENTTSSTYFLNSYTTSGIYYLSNQKAWMRVFIYGDIILQFIIAPTWSLEYYDDSGDDGSLIKGFCLYFRMYLGGSWNGLGNIVTAFG